MKKKLAMILVFVFAFTFLSQNVGAINVIMNSAFVKFPDQEPVIENGTTLVPIRTISELLGLEVGWDDPTDTVTIKKDNFLMELVIGSTKAKTSGGVKTLNTAPKIINGRTMVPLRFIAEELGLKVSWNDKFQRIVIAGEVDTQKVVQVPTEAETGVDEPAEGASDTDKISEEATEIGTEFFEEEIVEEVVLFTIEAGGSTIEFIMPEVFYEEDTESEESFAFKTLDGTDSQHTYNWEIVTRYESYADENNTSGIAFIVQEFAPYEGEEYDVSYMNQEYPDAPMRPEKPEADFDEEAFDHERGILLANQLFTDLGMEVPEGLEESEYPALLVFLADMDIEWLDRIQIPEEILELFGGITKEELKEAVDIANETIDLSQVEGYDEYLAYQDANQFYQEEMQIYREDKALYDREVANINAGKNYVARMFPSLYSQANDEDWAAFFDARLNTDEEVRFDGVEILDVDGKKIIHATLYAEDPDDEQGVYDYYYYIDGDCVVTIYGGTLFGSEPSPDAMEALGGMIIH